MAYLLPNDLHLEDSGTAIAFVSSDFTSWQAVTYPAFWGRQGGNCWVGAQGLPVQFNGLWYNGSDQLDPGWMTDDLLIMEADRCHWYNQPVDDAQWYAPRYNALSAIQVGRVTPRGPVDVLYVMGGVTPGVVGTGAGPYRFHRVEHEVGDLWVSVDSGNSFYPL